MAGGTTTPVNSGNPRLPLAPPILRKNAGVFFNRYSLVRNRETLALREAAQVICVRMLPTPFTMLTLNVHSMLTWPQGQDFHQYLCPPFQPRLRDSPHRGHRGQIVPLILSHRGAFSPPSSPSPPSFPSTMPAEINPSTFTPQELSKLSKKDLAKHLSTLQDMYTERGRKYGMC